MRALLLLLLACGPRQDPHHLEGQLEREVLALKEINRGLQQQVATCSDTGPPDPIYGELHQVYAGTEIRVDRRGPITEVSLPVGVLFTDDYGLGFREEATMSLDLLATALKLHPGHEIEVIGHTDDRMLPAEVARTHGTHSALSFAYASAVAHTLTDRFGVPEARFVISARGRTRPIASNDLPTGQAQNRRVVVRIRPGSAKAPAP